MSTADDDMRDKHGEKPEKWMPPKPNLRYIRNYIAPDQYLYAFEWFDAWYDKEIRPLFENAKEITGIFPTHKALLIKIEPIKEESAEDLLREYINMMEDKYPKVNSVTLYQKSKSYFERKK